MTRWWMVAGLACLVLAGCSLSGTRPSPDGLKPQLIFQPTNVDKVLACMQETRTLTGKAFREAFAAAAKQGAEGAEDGADLRLICLSLHENARHSQFRTGLQAVDAHVRSHPEESEGMRGLLLLMQRLDKERVSRWAQRNKWLEEKEELDGENKRLLERNGHLEQVTEQHLGRIQDLQNQIEQLKNIENIIKDRDR